MRLLFIFLWCTVCFLPYISASAFDITGGNSFQNIVWTKEEGPYVLPHDMVIDENTTLTIEAGTKILVENTTHISVYGSLVISGTTTDQVLIHPSSYEEYTSLHLHVFGGTVDVTGLQAISEISLYGNETARISINYSYFEIINEIHLFGQSYMTMRQSTVNSLDMALVKEQGSLTLDNSLFNALTGNNFAFNVFGTSTLHISDSTITPLFSGFLLLLDNSTLYATSTNISNANNHAIEALRNSKIYLDRVSVEGITSTGNESASFITLIGSSGFISNSQFTSSSGNGIELFNTGNIPYSTLQMSNSTIRDCLNTAIYAVSAKGTISTTRIQGNEYGIENMSSTISLSNSSIYDNNEYGVVAYVPEYPVSASHNFWGDTTGPYHMNNNPLGKGDEIFGAVSFHPWLASDPTLPCCSSVFFLPGFEASRLYRDGDKLWEPTSLNPFTQTLEQLFFNSQGTSVYTDVYTKDVIGEGVVNLVGPNIYKSFLADMKDFEESGTIQELRTFPYDWRFSVGDVVSASSSYMLKEIERTAHDSKTGKVTIVAHSNGGLVAKYLMKLLEQKHLLDIIDTAIFIAVPQYGTPSAIGALLHGFDQGMGPFVSGDSMREFGQNLPGAYGLLPSESYFNNVTDPVIEFAATSTFFGKKIDSISIFSDFLVGKEGRKTPLRSELSSAFTLHKNILSQATDMHAFIDRWLPLQSFEILQIAGWGIDTVRGIRYYTKEYKPLLVRDGDGTVVVPSALVLPTSTPQIHRYWIDLKAYNKGFTKNRTHADMLETTPVRELIKRTITGLPREDIDYVSTSTPQTRNTTRGLRFLLYADGASFDMYDSKRNHTGIASTTGFIEENVPGTYYREFGNVISISLSPEEEEIPHQSVGIGSYHRSIIIGHKKSEDFVLHQSDESALLEVEDEDKGESASIFYKDIPMGSTTQAILVIPPSLEISGPLGVDIDRDGIIDREIVPDYERESLQKTSQPVSRFHSRSGFNQVIATSSVKIIPSNITVYIDMPKEERVAVATSTIFSQKTLVVPKKTKQLSPQVATVWVSFEYIKKWLMWSMQKLLHILY